MYKLYVVVRSDLPKSYQAVQAGHAVAGFLLKYGDKFWNNETLIYLQASRRTITRILRGTFFPHPYYCFSEPDRNFQTTSFAVSYSGVKSLFPRLRKM